MQLKLQLTRSEENNLSLQHKIEKQKNDKQLYKKKIIDVTAEKNDFKIRVESLIRESQEQDKKREALKIDIQEYQRMIEKLEYQLKQKNTMISRSVSAKELPMTYDQSAQTDSAQFNLQQNKPRRNQSPIIETTMQDQIMSGVGQVGLDLIEVGLAGDG